MNWESHWIDRVEWRYILLTKTKKINQKPLIYCPIFCFLLQKNSERCVFFMNLILVLPPIFSWTRKKISLFPTILLKLLPSSRKVSIWPIPMSIFSLHHWVPNVLVSLGLFPWICGVSDKIRRVLSKMGQLITSSFWNCSLYLTWGTTLWCSLFCIIGHYFDGFYLSDFVFFHLLSPSLSS